MALDTDILFSPVEIEMLRDLGCTFTRRTLAKVSELIAAPTARFNPRRTRQIPPEENFRQRRLADELMRFVNERKSNHRRSNRHFDKLSTGRAA